MAALLDFQRRLPAIFSGTGSHFFSKYQEGSS
ncbi:MAG: hypothetical protein ACI8P0_005678, partial [Planctomycetaceae bacterium]